MKTVADQPTRQPADIAAWILASLALVLVLVLHLLPALLAGFLVYELVYILSPRLHIVRIRRRQRKLLAVAVLALGVVMLLALAVAGIVATVQREGGLSMLLQKLADIVDAWRTTLPAGIASQLPPDVDDLKQITVSWLREHAGAVQHAGGAAGRGLAHVIIGFGVGAIAALHEGQSAEGLGPLALALQAHAVRLGQAFRRVVFGQIRISAINALLTGLYIVVALPLFGIHVPLAKTMIVVTFVVGLLPVVGNLISNTVIVVLSLSVSPSVAVASLSFLVVIHKLEYFLNAQIVGAQVQAHAWELLLAMLVMEAAFGIPGLIAAPVYYAYLKDELVSRQLV